MKRREFITLLCGAAAVCCPTTRAEPQTKLPTIGILGASTEVGWSRWVAAFVQRLKELGWTEGRNVTIEYRWAEGRNERYAEIAAEFVRLNVDVIVTVGTAVAAAKQATSTIPIVFAVANDPIGGGLVTALARPGGNVTGLSGMATELAGKQVEILREVIPGLRNLGILTNAEYKSAILQRDEVTAAARTLSLEVIAADIRQAQDIVPAFETLKGRADALYICSDALVNTNRIRINILAAGARLPTISSVREYVEAGGLISYGSNFAEFWRRAAEYVDKILRGTKPGDIPVEQPTRFDFVINLTTAKAIGIELPATLLARADEVIE
jgi:putative tryptophan/tyrosine transport system substrate-binding protein